MKYKYLLVLSLLSLVACTTVNTRFAKHTRQQHKVLVSYCIQKGYSFEYCDKEVDR